MVNGEHRYQLIKKPKGTLDQKFFSASVVAFWNAKQHVCAPLFERPAIWAPDVWALVNERAETLVKG